MKQCKAWEVSDLEIKASIKLLDEAIRLLDIAYVDHCANRRKAMSNDRYEKIRKALAMGPTPGPRRVIDGDSHPYVTVALPENEGHRWDDPIICTLYEDVTPDDYVGFGECLQTFPNARANASFIAACEPDTIRALLEERDAALAALRAMEYEVKG